MSEKPILFKGEMVRAIMSGQKTQTRRVVNPQPPEGWLLDHWTMLHKMRGGEFVLDRHGGPIEIGYGWCSDDGQCGFKPRFYQSDLLYVREKWGVAPCYDTLSPSAIPLDSPRHVDFFADDERHHGVNVSKWRPSIHMPKWATRLWLEVTVVRCERVNEINEEDAKAEGVHREMDGANWFTYTRGFHALWDSINAQRGYGWDENPWVWVYEFKRHNP